MKNWLRRLGQKLGLMEEPYAGWFPLHGPPEPPASRKTVLRDCYISINGVDLSDHISSVELTTAPPEIDEEPLRWADKEYTWTTGSFTVPSWWWDELFAEPQPDTDTQRLDTDYDRTFE